MEVVIPAGGLGSRFLPVTSVVAKELLPLGRLPLIHHAVLEAEQAGFDSAVVVIAPGKSAIRTYFEGDPALEVRLLRRGDEHGAQLLRETRDLGSRMRLQFVQQTEPTGLGGAVLACRACVQAPIAVLLPDDVVPTCTHWGSMLSLHQETGGGVLSVREVASEETQRFGIAECAEENAVLRVTGLVEKPTAASSLLAVFGRYVVTEPVLEALARLSPTTESELQLTDAYAAILDRDPGVLAVKFSAEFYDCGTPQAYADSISRYTWRETGSNAAGS